MLMVLFASAVARYLLAGPVPIWSQRPGPCQPPWRQYSGGDGGISPKEFFPVHQHLVDPFAPGGDLALAADLDTRNLFQQIFHGSAFFHLKTVGQEFRRIAP